MPDDLQEPSSTTEPAVLYVPQDVRSLTLEDWALIATSAESLGLAARETLGAKRIHIGLLLLSKQLNKRAVDSQLEAVFAERSTSLALVRQALSKLTEDGLLQTVEIQGARDVIYRIVDEGETRAAVLSDVTDADTRRELTKLRRESALRVRMRDIYEDVFILNPQAKLNALERKAQPEDWEYRHTKTVEPKPILSGYLNYLYRAAKEQDLIVEATSREGKAYACFSTRLMTEHFDRIYAFMEESTHEQSRQRWFLVGFFDLAARQMSVFAEPPDPPSFFERPGDLLYDTRVPLRIRHAHVVDDNADRFPESMSGSRDERMRAVETAKDRALKRLEQNYKTAIPQYYWGVNGEEREGKLQLLLPLCLADYDHADMALVVDRQEAVYFGHTCLTLDMAYNNARLVARPDTEWLQP